MSAFSGRNCNSTYILQNSARVSTQATLDRWPGSRFCVWDSRSGEAIGTMRRAGLALGKLTRIQARIYKTRSSGEPKTGNLVHFGSVTWGHVVSHVTLRRLCGVTASIIFSKLEGCTPRISTFRGVLSSRLNSPRHLVGQKS